MKIYAKNILKEESILDKTIEIGDLKYNIMEFGYSLFNELDLPSNVDIQIGVINGFTDHKASVKTNIGTTIINGIFHSLSGKKITVTIPLVIYYGEILHPSTCKVNGKRYIFSKQLIHSTIKNLDCVKPVLDGMYKKNPTIYHNDTVNTNIFQIPKHIEFESAY